MGEEIAALDHLLGEFGATWPAVGNDGRAAVVYVISPFKKVAQRCKEVANRHAPRDGGQLSCGTVHTFQGKEADIVFVVLGSAPGRQGDGSRRWASQRPNLLNVAITRAKLRLYVVGNRQDWYVCPYFGDLAAALPVRELGEKYWVPIPRS